MLINNAVITGSFIVNGVDVTGITGSSAISSSYLALSSSYVITSASYAQSSASLSIRTSNLEATSSTLVSASSSFAAQSASLSTRLTTDEANIATNTAASASFAAQSSSLSTRLTTDETNFTNLSSSFATTSGSVSSRVTLIEGQYATTGSNIFSGTQRITEASNAISFTSTASLYTDGGLRVSKDSYVSGTAYFNNVVVYGTSSIQYITSSQVNFGTNIITVNTDTPAVRFGGLAVFDSGSTQLTGSMLWDSEKNHWIYSNPSGSSYNSAMLMNGPRNTGSLGNEQGTTSCALMVGQGGDHITSSMIYSYGNATCFYGTSYISSSGDACFASTVCAPSFIGGIMSGTTVYGSTIICSPVGKFPTCLTFGDWTTAQNVLSSNKPNEQGAYIRAAVSTAEYPTYAFEDDKDTGMYRDSANSLAFTTSGSSRMQISSTGDSLFNGTIAIQGACSSRICLIKSYSGSPSNVGLVISDTNGTSTFNHNANGGGTNISGITCIGSNFCVAGAGYFAGNVGLGITSPSANLDINASGGVGGYTGIKLKYGTSSVQSLSIGQVTAGNGAWIGMAQYNNAGYWKTEGTAAAVLNFESDGTFRISTNSGLTANVDYNICERMRITNAGNVGIRCATPGFTLDICGTANINNGCYASAPTLTITGQIYPIIDLISQDTNVGNRNWRIAGVSGNYGTFEILSSTAANLGAGTTRLAIDNIGRVGIGPLYPNYNLHICCSGQVISNIQVNSVSAGSEAGILITTPDSIGLLTVGASSGRGVNDACRCDMVMGLRTGGRIRFTTDVNANITQVSIANGITCFACQMCAPYAIFNGTAAITLPVGTTAQRPTAATGMIRFNSSCTELEYYNGSEWLFFTSTNATQGYYADVLIVGGGGGGGGAEASNGFGGGGAGAGAGGYVAGRIFINYALQSYPVYIGGGGTGGTNEGQSTGSGCNGTVGTASCALGFVAIGGGFGAGDETGTGGGNGGSGGGNGGDNGGTFGAGLLGQGCAGGASNTRNGGGGGGASQRGFQGYTDNGNGGNGRTWLNGTTYAGGGGGGGGSATTNQPLGGSGGGGNGSSTDGTSGGFQPGGTATAGCANTGGGGGGGAAGRAQGGQNGGSGIVVIRYFGSQKGFGGSVTSSGGYTYHSFTTSGTYCATYY